MENILIKGSGFEIGTAKLGRIRCRSLSPELLFKCTDGRKRAPDTVREFICLLLSIVGERQDNPDREITREQAEALTDEEIELLRQRFLETAIGPGAKAELATKDVERGSRGEELEQTFEAYEIRSARQSEALPCSPDSVPAPITNGIGQEREVIQSASTVGKNGSFWDSLEKTFSGLRNRCISYSRRLAREVYGVSRRFLAMMENRQKQNSAMSQHFVASLAMVEALKLDLANYEQTVVRSPLYPLLTATVPPDSIHKIVDQVEKLEVHLEELRADANQQMTKSTADVTRGTENRRLYKGAMAGFATLVVISLSLAMFHFITEANARTLETATQKLASAVQSLSDRIEVQTRQIAELRKQLGPKQRMIGKRAEPADAKAKNGRATYPQPHSLSKLPYRGPHNGRGLS